VTPFNTISLWINYLAQLNLFTNRYPLNGGETFLETEMKFLLPEFDQINIYPADVSGDCPKLDPKINVVTSFLHKPKSLRTLLIKYPLIIFKWWLHEWIHSPHRMKYISQWSYNWNRFIGLISRADQLLNAEREKNSSSNIYYSYWFNEWATVLALAKDMGLKGKFVTRVHGYDFDEHQQPRAYHPFRYAEWKKFDAIVQISHYGMQYQLKQFPKAGHLFLSRLGVLDNGINPIPASSKYHIVSCSGFVKLKRIPLLAEILKNLNVDFHWTHIGGGPGMEETMKEVLEILPSSSFTFLGQKENQEIIEYYSKNAVDLFINSSNLEGLPVSLMEAISFGIPIAGFDICGIPEIVNGHTGVLLKESNSPAVAANQLKDLLLNQSRNVQFRNGVRHYWQENFNAQVNYPMFINQFLKAV
jgi:glycosyltransferase involved in cell wall biosynthesis